jgi:hypothetical protein
VTLPKPHANCDSPAIEKESPALIVASEMGTKLDGLMWKKGWGKEAVILELEKIRAVTSGNGKRLVAPVTKTHRTIFEAFGLTDGHIKTYIAESLK